MNPFRDFSSGLLPLDRADVDTDQLMPKQFLSRVERDGYGDFVLFDWRRDPDFEFNRREFRSAKILVAGRNFGSGSSREHAAWGLRDYGIRAILAPSFGDIFRGNCRQVGIVTGVISQEDYAFLIRAAVEHPTKQYDFSLEEQSLKSDSRTFHFDIDQIHKHMLLEGLDDIELMRIRERQIRVYERQRPSWMPSLGPASVRS